MEDKNILFIVEGEKDEVQILGRHAKGMLGCFGIKAEIVSINNPIYEIYDFLLQDNNYDIVSYLKSEKKIKIGRSKTAFSSIYLIFDLEHHYHKYSDDKIIKMQKYFSNETENGKLYINYPMIESFYYIKSIPDLDYFDRYIDIALIDKNGEKYKKLVNSESCIVKNKMTKEVYIEIIKRNLEKSKYILKIDNNNIDYEKILEYELNMINKEKKVSVLSTLPLFIFDEYTERFLERMI